MGLERRGFVGLLKAPLDPIRFDQMLEVWLSRFDTVEQLRSGGGTSLATFRISGPDDTLWEKDMQFRVLSGQQFAWVYLTDAARIVESDGLADPAGPSLALDVFLEMELFERVVSDRDETTLEEWEKQGYI
ncbi:MAG: hypothetical protein JO317_02545 [Verrucomicrobiae bacterium]|nr:hypothetical protein [Verrucomicrobiae bacterium]